MWICAGEIFKRDIERTKEILKRDVEERAKLKSTYPPKIYIQVLAKMNPDIKTLH